MRLWRWTAQALRGPPHSRSQRSSVPRRRCPWPRWATAGRLRPRPPRPRCLAQRTLWRQWPWCMLTAHRRCCAWPGAAMQPWQTQWQDRRCGVTLGMCACEHSTHAQRPNCRRAPLHRPALRPTRSLQFLHPLSVPCLSCLRCAQLRAAYRAACRAALRAALKAALRAALRAAGRACAHACAAACMRGSMHACAPLCRCCPIANPHVLMCTARCLP
jgi:hypothetical protein